MAAHPAPKGQLYGSAMRTALSARWAGLAPREQRGVQVAAWLVGGLLVWWVLLAPAFSTLKKADSQRLAQEQQLDAVLALQVRARALQAQATVDPADALASLQSDVAVLGSGARLQVAADQATLHLQKVRADALARWLVQPTAASRLQPAEVHWVRDADKGADATWSGTVVFNLPAGTR